MCRGFIWGILKEVMSKQHAKKDMRMRGKQGRALLSFAPCSRIFSQLTWFTLTIKMESLLAEQASSYFYQIFHSSPDVVCVNNMDKRGSIGAGVDDI